MSKRVEEAARRIHDRAILEAKKYSNSHGGSITEEVSYGRGFKAGFIEGYEQAEKDTIERAVAWLKDYVKYFELYDEKGVEEFKKAMEKE